MCNNRKLRKAQAAEKTVAAPPSYTPAKLEVTCDVEDLTYRDEGGRFNYLFVNFVLRTDKNGLPAQLQGVSEVPLECTLQYEDGTTVEEKEEPGLKVLGPCDPVDEQKVKEQRVMLDVHQRHGSIRYKVMKLSRNHDGKKFRVKVALAGISEEIVAPLYTRSTLVLSKRKWLSAAERSPEIEVRKQLEVQSVTENTKLGQLAAKDHACEQYEVSIRDIAGLTTLERQYPELQSLHDEDDTASSDVASLEDKDVDYVPSNRMRSTSSSSYCSGKRRASSYSIKEEPRKQPRLSSKQSSGASELAALMKQVQLLRTLMEDANLDRERRIAILEEENVFLRERLNEVSTMVYDLQQNNNNGYKMPKKLNPFRGDLDIAAAPLLDLPRSHSLGPVPGEEVEAFTGLPNHIFDF